jgi:DNA repair exonuclease SbcCD nuclease subunit
MNKVKILQFGDLHFDTPFSELNFNDSEKRREDLRETFGKIIRLAQEEKVHIILITGDLFDNDSAHKATIDYIIKILSSIPHIRVFISPGNHDPLSNKGFYKIIKWPSNVHIFEHKLEGIIIEELKVTVYGIAFDQKHIETSLLKGFIVQDNNYINLMVMHGDVNLDGKSLYNPITISEIEESKLDYIGFGHKHTYSGIKRNGVTFWAYAGNPEGRGFDELGSKGVLIGEIGKEFNDLKYVETCKRKYLEETVDITGVGNYEEVANAVLETLVVKLNIKKDKLNEFTISNLFKIILVGKVDKDFYINTSVIKEKLHKDFFYIKLIDKTEPNFDYDSLLEEYSLRGIFTKKIMQRKSLCSSKEEEKNLFKALNLGLKCLEDKEVNLDDD